MFHFKQFSVDQSGCAMKINTDGVLLGALAEANDPESILDIGTGTGVIALMLAQKFTTAKIDAIEIDNIAAQTAERNFKNSPFAGRPTIYSLGFESFFSNFPEKKYDLIVSNPPFYINSLKSSGAKKKLAKHTDKDFFEQLITDISSHLNTNGVCWLILPLEVAELVKELAESHKLHLQKIIALRSFKGNDTYREIIALSLANGKLVEEDFVIYNELNVYSEIYKSTLKNFFIIFDQ